MRFTFETDVQLPKQPVLEGKELGECKLGDIVQLCGSLGELNEAPRSITEKEYNALHGTYVKGIVVGWFDGKVVCVRISANGLIESATKWPKNTWVYPLTSEMGPIKLTAVFK